MNRQDIEQYFYDANSEKWPQLIRSGRWNLVHKNKIIEKIYSEARDWAVTLGNMGMPGPKSDEEKISIIDVQLQDLDELIAKANQDPKNMKEPIYVEIINLGKETLANTKALYMILKKSS